MTGEITKDEYVISSKTLNPHRACRDQAKKEYYTKQSICTPLNEYAL